MYSKSLPTNTLSVHIGGWNSGIWVEKGARNREC